MAQCYTRPRNHIASQPTLSTSGIVHRDGAPQNHSLDRLAESIYVFPNPSSAPPSPSVSSDFSVPTDLTISTRSHSWSRSRARGDSRIRARSPLSASADVDFEVWDWTADLDAEDSTTDASGLSADLEEALERANRWDLLQLKRSATAHLSSPSPKYVTEQRLGSPIHRAFNRSPISRHRSRASSGATPHPRIHIPLLSMLSSFLSIDDSTLHLLTNTSSHSALFPGHAIDPDPTLVDGPGETDSPHGIIKLFTRSLEKTNTLAEGCAVACDSSVTPMNPFIVPGLHLKELWGLVSEVWVNGGKAWRDVWR